METKSPQPKGTDGTSPKQSKVCPRCGGELIEGEIDYVGGGSLSRCVVTGRAAGKNAAKEA